MRYTFYVFKPEVVEFDDIFSAGKIGGRNGFEHIPVNGVNFTAQAYLQRNIPSTPSWLPFISAHCEIPPPQNIKNRSNSFVLAIRNPDGRLCALTYGRGFQALDRNRVEQDFGLDVACRLLTSASIKEIESKALGSEGLHKHQVASTPGDLATFPLQRARDHVNRIGGRSPDAQLGTRITGATSCMIGGKIPFIRLGEVCMRLVASMQIRPNARLAALRPFEAIKSGTVINGLNAKLLAALTPQHCDSVGLFLPEMSHWQAIDQFEVSWTAGEWAQIDDLDITSIVAGARGAVGNQLELSALKVRGISDAGEVIIERPIIDFAAFETSFRRKAYALKDGTWFGLRQDYVDRCTRDFANIEIESAAGYLPRWRRSSSEGQYNTSTARGDAGRLVCLDQDNIQVDGRAVEPCDLLTVDGHFIHVKKWSSSQTFSALIKQGQNSAILLESSEEFRDGVVEKLPPAWRRLPYWRRFVSDAKPSDIRIVFAIGASAARQVPASLPFFSRQSLFDTCAALRALYYNVRVCHVGYI